MSQPHTEAGSGPAHSGQFKTLFVQEGNPACLLVVREGRRIRHQSVEFATSLAAFEWCREGGICLVYRPVDPEPDPSRN